MVENKNRIATFLRRLRGTEDSGAAVVEFALVAPVLLLLVVGVFEFGRVWNIYQAMTDAAREGARRIAVADGSSWAAIEPAVWNSLALSMVDTTKAKITPAASGFGAGLTGDGASGSDARVDITYEYTFNFLGNIPTLVGGSNLGTITFSTYSVMRNE